VPKLPLLSRIKSSTKRLRPTVQGLRHKPFMVKLLELLPILLKLRQDNLLRLAQGIQTLSLAGIYNPTHKQISIQANMSMKTLSRNKEAIAIIKFAFAYEKFKHTMKCLCISGTYSRGYMHPNTEDIWEWFTFNNSIWHYRNKSFFLQDGILTYDGSSIELPKRQILAPIEQVCLSLGITISNTDNEVLLDASTISFKHILYALFTMALLNRKLINQSFSLTKRFTYGKHIAELYLCAIAGTQRIPSSNKHLRWLNESDTLGLRTKLFSTGDLKNYRVGHFSMKYTPTLLMQELAKSAIDYMQLLNFHQTNKPVLAPLDFIMDKSLLKTLKLQDIAILLNDCIGYSNGFIIRPVPLDRQYSRIYSCFTTISSETRKALDFINYDIGAALQTICLQLVNQPSLYPLHQDLVTDKVAFRQKIMNESGESKEWVKQELSKLDNKETPPKYNHPTLKAYYQEAQQLRKEVINTTQNTEQEIYNKAYLFAKINYKKHYNSQTKKYDFIPNGRKESSIFFFIWTQYERQIREAMKQCFSNPQACQEVHDAIYSKENVNISLIEQRVYKDTNFKVQISH